MICPNCKKENTENIKWCCYCGSLLELSPMEFELDEVFETPEQELAQPASSRNTFKKKEKAYKEKTHSQPPKKICRRKKKSHALLWILLILFTLSFAFAACMFFVPSFNQFIEENLLFKNVGKGNNATGVQQDNQTDESITGFCSDWQYFSVGESQEVTFCARASIAPTLYLYNTAIGLMNDNGQNGDIRANDGVYSYKLTVQSDVEKADHYYAGFESPISESVVLHFFDQPTEDEKQLYLATQNRIELINAELEDNNGLINAVDKEKALQAVSKYSEQLLADGIISEYRVNEDNVYICFSSGLPYLYIPNVEGYLSSGDEFCFQIITCQPFKNQFYNTNINDVAYEITTNFSNYSLKARPENDLVTTQMVKDYFGPNQIILWFGHGAYDSGVHSLLITGEPCINGLLYWGDYLSHRMMSSSAGKIAISSKYIDCYCKNMNNTLVYLNTCLSGKTDTLAKAFLNKGASAVVCNSETIKATYAHYIQISTMNNLQCINSDSGNYNTLLEALSIAKEEYGYNDLDYGGTGAETIIKGYNDFRLANIEKIDDKTDEDPFTSTFFDVEEITYETWSEVYKNFLLNQNVIYEDYGSKLIGEKTFTVNDVQFFKGQYSEPKFSLYDMDGNGIPELIVYNGASALANAVDHVFSLQNNQVIYLGKIGFRGCELYCYDDLQFQGLFCSDGNNGIVRTVYYELRNGNITSEELNMDSTGMRSALQFYTIDEIQTMGWEAFVNAAQSRIPMQSAESGSVTVKRSEIPMDAGTQYTANIFLSNFSEQNAFVRNGFDVNNPNYDDLIQFVYLYCKINRRSSLNVETTQNGSFYTVTLDTVNNVLNRHFGITLTQEQASQIGSYRNGSFYFIAADGEAYNKLTVVNRIESLGNDTYELSFDIYTLNLDVYYSNNGSVYSGYYYTTADSARANSDLTWKASGIALVRPYSHDGIQTMQLIRYSVY